MMENRKRKTILFSTLISSICLVYSFFGVDLVLADIVSNKNETWLKDIDDEKSISSIAIPGTHNSGALYSFLDLSGKCQDLTIKKQLEIGVRFLDIRLENDTNGLKVVHDFIDQKLSFMSVLKTCYNFLDENPSEFIFMSIKEEGNSNSKSTFASAVYDAIDDDKFILDKSLPSKVKDARGKIIPLSRYSDANFGVDCYTNWLEPSDDSNTFDLTSSNIHVQDYYEVNDLVNKQNEIKNCIEYNQDNILKLNFTSGYYDSLFPPANAAKMAKDINPWLLYDILPNIKATGIFVSDYITEDLAYAIIGENE